MTIIAIVDRVDFELTHFPSKVQTSIVETRNWSAEKVKGIYHTLQKDNLWKEWAKPIYERHIKPMDEIDAAILGSGFGSAAIIMILACTALNLAFFPLSGMLATLLICANCSISATRVSRHYDKMACEKIDAIWIKAVIMKPFDRDFTEIKNYYNQLYNSKEYKHREKDIENLRKEIEAFEKASKLNSGDFPGAKKTFLNYLKNLHNVLNPTCLSPNYIEESVKAALLSQQIALQGRKRSTST
jgi:hypothetical protein